MNFNFHITKTMIGEVLLVILVAGFWQLLKLQYGDQVSIDFFIDAVFLVNICYMLLKKIEPRLLFLIAFILLLLSAISNMFYLDQLTYLFSSLTVTYLLLGSINLFIRRADLKKGIE